MKIYRIKAILQIFNSALLFSIEGLRNVSVTCLATDACLTVDPGVGSPIPAGSHTFVEIDHEIISTVILLPSADSFKSFQPIFFNIFGGFRKKKIFWNGDFVDIFGGSSQSWTIFRGHFYAF